MFSDIWVISEKYDDPAGLEMSPGDFDAQLAAAKARCPEDPEGFTDLSIDRLNDCFLIPDISEAVDRILDAADTGEKVAVFGDYDCDGVCATALLYDFLKKSLEMSVIWRVPERREGYGLSVEVIDELALKGVTLIITVDNGISAVNEVDYCESRGIDVIVTDHHEVTGDLPAGLCNCDPMRADSVYPAKNICGCVVAYKLCEAISISLGIDGIENYLPLAAVATIGDIMELRGENRSIVKVGLDMIEDTMFPGLNVLVSDRKEKKRSEKIDSEFLSYYIVPVLNAAGRMGNAADAVRLLLSESEKEALPLLYEILELSDKRKAEVERLTAEYEADPQKYLVGGEDGSFLFVRGENWNEGIIGVIAGKLCEKYNKNVCVLTEDHALCGSEPVFKASVRGAGKLNVVKVMSSCSDLLVKFGGHEGACGFSVAGKNLPALKERVEEVSKAMGGGVSPVNVSEALLYLPPRCITLETAENLKKLEPFGEGNGRPVFVTGGIEHMEAVKYGDPARVIRFGIRFAGGYFCSGVNFKDVKFYDMISYTNPAAVVYTLSVNEFNGKRTPQMNVIDIIEGDSGQIPSGGATYGKLLESTDICLFKAFHMTKEDLNTVYRALKGIGGSFGFSDVSAVKKEALKKGGDTASLFTWFKLKYALEIFIELGLVEKERAGYYRFTEIREKKNLLNSKTFDAIGTRYE